MIKNKILKTLSSIITRNQYIKALRILSMDIVEHAGSGHPGMPMGMADVAGTLWHDFLRHNPSNPAWFNRDRFVLSNGHGSALLYALLHLSGYDLSIDDLKQFRQLHSKTPGHPEWKNTPGVETTTGPLGQGLANAVGMAIAQTHLAATFNRTHFNLIDHYVYVFVGDGCLMEGISHEVCSLAGVLGLGKLIVFYDDNGISIDGPVKNWFSDNTPQRFAAYGWHVIPSVDGHNPVEVRHAIIAAQAELKRPTLICCDTIIGYGSPHYQGSHRTHGAPLGSKEVDAVREHLQWSEPPFKVPQSIRDDWDARERGALLEEKWNDLFSEYRRAYPDLAAAFERRLCGHLPKDYQEYAKTLVHRFNDELKMPLATRVASQQCLAAYSAYLPEIVCGSADLMESNGMVCENIPVFSYEEPRGRFIHYGVREFGMAAIMNGMALSQAILPIGGTFLTFSDYARNAIRLSALMELRLIFILTHDSIGLGEDGPTHQPIEHISSLRAIPNLCVWRPCDAIETASAWSVAIAHQGPSCLILSRQALPAQLRTKAQLDLIERGGYILIDHARTSDDPSVADESLNVVSDIVSLPDVIVLATGSEVQLAVAAAQMLLKDSIYVRVVSMPSTEMFLKQTQAYQESVLPKAVSARLAIEAATPYYWHSFVGSGGAVIGINQFGLSAPGKEVFAHYGFSVNHTVNEIKNVLKKNESYHDN